MLSTLNSPKQYKLIIVVCTKAISKDENIMQIKMSLDRYGHFSIRIKGNLAREHDESLCFQSCDRMGIPIIQYCCEPKTPTAKVDRLRSRFKKDTIRAINVNVLHTIEQMNQVIK